MSIRISKRIVEAEKPTAKDRFIFDAEVKGFGLKITPAGRKVYILQYRMGGRNSVTKRYTIAEHGEFTAEQARDEAIKLRGQIRMGVDPQREKKARALPPPASQTFAETADAYLRQCREDLAAQQRQGMEAHCRTRRETRWEKERRPRPSLAAMYASRSMRSRGAARDIQANRTLARLKTLFNWAMQQDIIPASPVAGLKPQAKEVERDRVLSDDELRWFWAAATSLAGRSAHSSSCFCLRPSAATRSARSNGAI